MRHESVRMAAVIAGNEKGGQKQLIAYVVPEAELNASELRAYLKHDLPDYMVPSVFVTLAELPLTPNAKVDRRQLERLARDAQPQTGEYVAPRNATEEILADLWTEVLELERAGIHDDFFALGGHSLLATQLLSRVQKIFPVDLPLRTLFERPTVAGLYDALAVAYEGDLNALEEIAEMVKELRQMSEHELQQMLAVSA
jgi:phosphopantetheine binding protein/AMP-binding enzyme